jgi:Cu2+-exporting ATPase
VQTALEEEIVVFDETVFERVRGADTVVFDKTGTLTTGDLTVLHEDAPDDLLRLAAELEAQSAHPVATAIVDAYGPQTDGGAVTEPAAESASNRVEAFENHTRGVSGSIDGTEIAAGHPTLFETLGWSVAEDLADRVTSEREAGRLPILLGREETAEGLVVLGDELRAGWSDVVTSLDQEGIDVVVLTGDDERATLQFAEHDSIDQVFAGVPPEAKAETVARLSARGETVMVGDGTNDAPALARADLGIALGGGTAMAVDAADVAIVDDSLESVERLFELSRATGSRITQNIGWALCYNVIAIPLAVSGLLNPLFAAVAMATSSLLVVANSSRPLE